MYDRLKVVKYDSWSLKRTLVETLRPVTQRQGHEAADDDDRRESNVSFAFTIGSGRGKDVEEGLWPLAGEADVPPTPY